MKSPMLKEVGIFAGILALTAVLSLVAYTVLVPQSHNTLFISLETKLKGLLKKQIESQEEVNKNKTVGKALEKIRRRLVDQLDAQPYTIEIMVVNAPEINAFTLPGGLIVVNSALLNTCGNAEEAAAVIAHELGHVIRGDSMKRITRQFGWMALLLATGGPNSAGSLKQILQGAIDNQFTRQQEDEADDFALQLLEKAEIHPIHFADFLTRLSRKEPKILKQSWMRYLSTHSLTKDRIQKAKETAREFEGRDKKLGIRWDAVKESIY